jgi:hypothetical protein
MLLWKSDLLFLFAVCVRDSTKLLEEKTTRVASLLQGVFELQVNDVIFVKASAGLLDKMLHKSSYVGLYLLRTS